MHTAITGDGTYTLPESMEHLLGIITVPLKGEVMLANIDWQNLRREACRSPLRSNCVRFRVDERMVRLPEGVSVYFTLTAGHIIVSTDE